MERKGRPARGGPFLVSDHAQDCRTRQCVYLLNKPCNQKKSMKFTPSTPKASHDPVPTIVTRRLWTSDWSSADAHSDPTPVVALSNANHSAVLQGEPCGPTRMLTRGELLFGLRFILSVCILTLVAVEASAVDCTAIASVRPRVAIAR